jgi:hypothetical protein
MKEKDSMARRQASTLLRDRARQSPHIMTQIETPYPERSPVPFPVVSTQRDPRRRGPRLGRSVQQCHCRRLIVHGGHYNGTTRLA